MLQCQLIKAEKEDRLNRVLLNLLKDPDNWESAINYFCTHNINIRKYGLLSIKNKQYILSKVMSLIGDIADKDKLQKLLSDAQYQLSLGQYTQYTDRVPLAKSKLTLTEIHLDTPSAFAHGVSPKLSSDLYKEILTDIQDKITFMLNFKGIIINSEDLSKSLNDYKNALIGVLYKYVTNDTSTAGAPNIYSNNILEFYKNYKELIELAISKLEDFINGRNGVVDSILDGNLRYTFYDPYKALIILQNFDLIVERMSNNTVVVNNYHKNDIAYLEEDKYKFTKDTIYESSFEDGLRQNNGEHVTPNILKNAFSVIKISDDGTRANPLLIRKIIETATHLYAGDAAEGLKEVFESDKPNIYKLKAVLTNPEFTQRFSSAQALAILDWFDQYNNAYLNSYPPDLDIAVEKERQRDLVGQLVHTIQSLFASHYISVTPEGNKVSTTVDRYLTKKHIYTAIRNAAKNNYQIGADYVYSAGWGILDNSSVKSITEVFSTRAKSRMSRLLGFVLNPIQIEELSTDDNLGITGDCLRRIQELYMEHLANKQFGTEIALDTALDAFVLDLVNSPEFIAFSNILVSKEISGILKIYDLLSNMLPGENIYTTILDFRKNLNSFRESFKHEKPSLNVLITNPLLIQLRKDRYNINTLDLNYTSHVLWRSDICYKVGEQLRISAPALAEPSENMAIALGFDWIKSVLDTNTMYLLIEGVSDKPRIPIHAYNLAEFHNPNDDKIVEPFYTKTFEELKSLWELLHISYYQELELLIVDKWNLIASNLANKPASEFNTVEDIIKYLDSNNISYLDFHNSVVKLQLLNSINVIDQVDYMVDSNNNVTLNPSLVLKIVSAYKGNDALLDSIYTLGLNSFIENFNSLEVPNLLKSLSRDISDDLFNKLYDLFEIKEDNDTEKKALKALLKNKFWAKADSKSTQENALLLKLMYKILSRYYAFSTLFKDADLQISIKFPWIHTPKKANMTLNSKDIEALSGPNPDIKAINAILVLNLSPRLVAGKKRNSSAVAAYTPQAQGLRFGVPKTMKVAMVKFPKQAVENHFGIKDAMKPHDGASFTFGIYSFFEENSYPGHHFEGTRKTIGLIPHFGGFTQIKHADNTLTNELLRGMATPVSGYKKGFNSNEDTLDAEFHADELVRTAYELCTLNTRFVNNLHRDLGKISFNTPYYKFGNRLARMANFEVDNPATKTFKITWEYLDNGKTVPYDLVKTLINGASDVEIGGDPDDNIFVINNLYQLYNAFGGYNSMSENEFGHIDYSEISNIICGLLIGWYDVAEYYFDANVINRTAVTPMKELMLAKICDPESVKSSLIMVNSPVDLRTNKLTYSFLDTSHYGILLDYTHESEDSKIPALTLVITAVAFNGHNSELVLNMYEALGLLISNSLYKYVKIPNSLPGTKLLNKKLAIRLLDSLRKNSVASTAFLIVLDFLNNLAKDGFFTFSNKDIFYKVTSDIVANLNTDTIKLKFDGIAVIQAPSLGIIMLYEGYNAATGDSNWYTRTDILKLVREDAKYNDLSDNDAILAYFEDNQSEFGDRLVTKSNFSILNIGDKILYLDNKGNTLFISLDTPADLREAYDKINSGKAIYKVYRHQRDLGVTKITWTEVDNKNQIVALNLFCIESTLNLINKQTLLKKLKEDPNATVLAIAEALANVNKALLWHRANLEGLSSERPYYYKTEDDYLNDTATKNTKTYVLNFLHKNGLLVLPRVQSTFGIQDASISEIKRKGYEFFIPIVQNKYAIKTPLQEGLAAFAMDGGEVILTKSLDETTINESVSYDILKIDDGFFVVDNYGNRKLKIPHGDYAKCVATKTTEGKDVLYLVLLEEASLNDEFNNFRNIQKNNINNYASYSEKEVPVAKLAIPAEGGFNKLAKDMYNSWLLSNYTISARIPSLSFLSFLTTETVAYTENNFNIGYMNIWEMWFLGSDFDIDKAYTMMYSLDRKGKTAGHVFTDYSSPESIQASLKLPLAKYKRIELVDANVETQGILDLNNSTGDSNLSENDKILKAIWDNEEAIDYAVYRAISKIKELYGFESDNDANIDILMQDYRYKYIILENIINTCNTIADELGIIYLSKDYLPASGYITVADLIKYKNEGTTSLRNRIMLGIYSLARDLKNLESAELPMEMAPVTSMISKVYKDLGIKEDLTYNEYDPFTIYTIQRANSIGKTDVGIAANGVKAAGALQHHFNRIYKLLDADLKNLTEDRENFNRNTFSLDIVLNYKNAEGETVNIVNLKFFRLGNTKMSYKTFETLFTKAYENDSNVTNSENYKFYISLCNNENVVPKNSYLLKLLTDFKVFKGGNIGKETILGFKELLYNGIKTEDNVADIISIFISMATDNAKELALLKINGTPELLSLPLAMLTLGIDLESTITTCVVLLDKIAALLEVNKFVDNKTLDVRKIIFSLGIGKSAVFDANTRDSLLAIYDFALELRDITSFFKVNQGVTTRLAELKGFTTSLADSRYRHYKDKIGKEPDEENASIKEHLNFNKLFNADETAYLERIKKDYDLSKTVINVMDVVLKSPHFTEQLKSTAFIVDLIENRISGKAKLASILVDLHAEDFEVNPALINEAESKEESNNDIANKEIIDSYDKSVVKGKTALANLNQRIYRLIDSYIIKRFLEQNPALTLSISEIKNMFKDSTLTNLGIGEVISLDTNRGLDLFTLFVYQDLIPYLQDAYPGNFFLEHLKSTSNKRLKRAYYDLEFDPYAIKDNPTIANNFNLAKNEFNRIADIKLDLRTTSGDNYTIGDILHVYSIITGLGLTTGLFTVTADYTSSKLISKSINDCYKDLDKLVQNNHTEEDYSNNRLHLLSIAHYLAPRVRALLENNNTTGIVIDGLEYNLDLNTSWVPAMAEPEIDKLAAAGKNLSDLIKVTFGDRVNIRDINIIDSPTNKNIKNISFTAVDLNTKHEKEFEFTVTLKSKLVVESDIKTITDSIEDFLKNEQIFFKDNTIQSVTNNLNLFEVVGNEASPIATIKELLSEEEWFLLGTPNDDLLTEAYTYFTDTGSDYGIVILKDSSKLTSHVRYISDRPYLFINPNNFKKESPEYQYAKALLLDLYLQIKSKSSTEIDKLTYALNALYKDNNTVITVDNFLLVYRDLANSEEGIPKYLKNLVNIYDSLDVSNNVKILARNLLAIFLNAIRLLHIYYMQVPSNIKDNNFKVGDIYYSKTRSTGLSLYLYIGTTKMGKKAFVRITNNPKSKYVLLYDELLVKENLHWQKTQVLGENIIVGNITKSNFKYPTLDSQKLTLDQCTVGDIVTLGKANIQFLVTDIILSKDPFNLDNSLFKRIVLKNLNNDSILSLTKDSNTLIYKGIDMLLNNDIIQISSDTKLPIIKGESKIPWMGSNNYTEVQGFGEFSHLAKLKIINRLQRGAKIKSNKAESYFIQKLNNDTIQTSTGIMPIESIDTVYLRSFEYDSDLENSTNVVPIMFRKDYESNAVKFEWLPEFSEGYKVWDSSAKRSAFGGNWVAYMPVSYIEVNKKIVELPKFTPPPGFLLSSGNIKLGDIIVTRDVTTGTLRVKKILDAAIVKGKRKISYEECIIDRDYKKTYTIKEQSELIINELDEIYSKYNSRRVNINVSSPKTRAMVFLERISKLSGMSIDVLEMPAVEFNAKVDYFNNKIIIQIPSNVKNPELYIMLQAAHEFTHVILATIRVNNPTLYYNIVKSVNKERFKGLNGDVYTNDIAMSEEVIVRTIEEQVTKNIKNNTSGDDLLLYLEDAFLDVTGSSIQTFQASVDSVMRKSSFFKSTVNSIDINRIRHLHIKDEVLNEIEKLCL